MLNEQKPSAHPWSATRLPLNNLTPIAKTARLEAAIETLAEYIGYLSGEIDSEQSTVLPDAGRIQALEHSLDAVLLDRRNLSVENEDVICRALNEYAKELMSVRG